jgi:hypothetical protein
MSSPTALAGQKPITAFGLNQRSSTICRSMVWAGPGRPRPVRGRPDHAAADRGGALVQPEGGDRLLAGQRGIGAPVALRELLAQAVEGRQRLGPALAGEQPDVVPEQGPAARALFEDAQTMLRQIVEERWFNPKAVIGSDRQVLGRPSRFESCWRRPWKVASASVRLSPVKFNPKAVIGFWPANAVGDDIRLFTGESRTEALATFHGPLLHDLPQHGLGVLEQGAGGRALFGVVEDRRVAALELVGLEERRQRLQAGLGGLRADQADFHRHPGLPQLRRGGSGALLDLGPGMGVGDALVLGPHGRDGLHLGVGREQARHHAGSTSPPRWSARASTCRC